MESIKSTAPTMVFRLPAQAYGASLSHFESERGRAPYQLADTLFVTYEQFREAIGISRVRTPK